MPENNSYPISEQDLTEQSFRTLLWLGDQIPGGFFIDRADDSQEILYANRALLRIFGCQSEAEFRAITGNTFRGMVHPDDFEEIQASIDRQIENEQNQHLDYVEYRITRTDGSIRWVDDYGHFAHLPGYGDVYYVFISDVTEKRLAEQERLRIAMELERERQLGEMRSSFLFNMSHDIRTPMNAVIGYSQLARRHIGDAALLDGYLEKTIASGQQMLSLIDDMLEMNRLEKGMTRLREEKTDLREQIEMVLDLHRPDAGEKGVTLTESVELPETAVMLDRNAFRRIISNLVSNAVKFTPAGGTVTVSAERQRTGDSGFARFRFRVADTGIGIAKEFQARMYDAFERAGTSTETGETGTGLGLPIVRSLLNLMGGSVFCESEEGKGTVFTVELPLKLADAPLPALPGEGDPGIPKAEGEYRLLVVEDIELNRELEEELLTESGFLVESVPDGSYAVEAVRNRPVGYYDLILMDIQMPVMNGYEAARAIRAIPREDIRALPIIALSANARPEDKRMCLECGMNGHVAKPFDIDRLVDTINEAIRQRGAS